PVIPLQPQRGGQQARRHTRPPVVATVECGEVFVTEQLIPLRGEKPVEVLSANEVPVQRVRLKHAPLRRPLTEHSPYAPFRSDLLRLPYPSPYIARKPLTPFPDARLGLALGLAAGWDRVRRRQVSIGVRGRHRTPARLPRPRGRRHATLHRLSTSSRSHVGA